MTEVTIPLHHISTGELESTLISLAHHFEMQQLPLVLVGGFCMVLRNYAIQAHQAVTLVAQLPVARTTNDFDVLLPLEVLVARDRSIQVREVLNGLGFRVIDGREYLQFYLPGSSATGQGDDKNIKVDLLAPSPAPEEKGNFAIKQHRIRPRAKIENEDQKLHAYLAPEVLAHDRKLRTLHLEGNDRDGVLRTVTVQIPSIYTLLGMKLHAFEDETTGKQMGARTTEPRPDYARKHAGDVYRLLAMATGEEMDDLQELLNDAELQASGPAASARRIVSAYFMEASSPGSVEMQKSTDCLRSDLETVLAELQRIFPVT